MVSEAVFHVEKKSCHAWQFLIFYAVKDSYVKKSVVGHVGWVTMGVEGEIGYEYHISSYTCMKFSSNRKIIIMKKNWNDLCRQMLPCMCVDIQTYCHCDAIKPLYNRCYHVCVWTYKLTAAGMW